MAIFKRGWPIVGQLVLYLACQQLIQMADCNFQLANDRKAQGEAAQRGTNKSSTTTNNQTDELDEILRDTSQLLDTLDRKLQAVNERNRTQLERRHELDEGRLLASLAEGFSSERRPTAAKAAPESSADSLQADPSEQDQQQAPPSKQSRQLTGGGDESAARFTDQNQFTERHIRFSLDLMRAVFAGHTKANSIDSFLISPVSIQTVLMMMQLGARGQTKRELGNCLHLLGANSSSNPSGGGGGNQQNSSSTTSGRNPKLFRRHPQQTTRQSVPRITQQQQQQANSFQQGNQLHEQFGGAMRQLLRDPTVTKALTSVNQIFIQRDLSLASQFEWAIKNYYGTELKFVDFQNQDNNNNEQVNKSSSNSTANSSDLQLVINEWVERQTKGKISNFLTSPVASSTMLMALNLVFFKGDWQYKFDPGDTEPEGLFTLPSGKSIKVPMMVNKLPLAHAHDPNMRASLIELPYKAQRLSLFILLPDEHNGIFDAMRLLTPNSFASLVSQMRKQPASSTASAEPTGGGINVRIPKFTIESSPRMSQILSQQLGLKTLFSADVADLSGMFSTKSANHSTDQIKPSPTQVGLDELLHKAVLEVHEQGSVAAAASATIVERVGAFNGQYFEADHTFLFLLMDKQTGLILFSGVFAGPQNGQTDNSMLDNQNGLRKAQPVGSSMTNSSTGMADGHNTNLLAAARSLKQMGARA